MKRIFLLLLSLCLVLSACAPGENAVSSEAPLSTVPEETAPRETLTPSASEPASAETAAGPSASPEAPTAPAQPAKIPEEPSVPTVLFAFTAGPNAADNRRQISSNSTQSWCRKASVGADTALTLDTWNFYNNYDTGKGGLQGEERIWFSPEGLQPFSTDDFYAIELEIGNIYVSADSDINMNTLGSFRIAYAADGSTQFTATDLPLRQALPERSVTMADGKAGVLYRLRTEDLLTVLPEHCRITALRVLPFGDYSAHFGGLRLTEVRLTGYSGLLPELVGAPAKAETVHIDEETLRNIVVTHSHRITGTLYTLPRVAYTYNFTHNGFSELLKYTMIYPADTRIRGALYSRASLYTAAELQEIVGPDGVYTAGYTDDTAAGMDCHRFVHDCISAVTPIGSFYGRAFTDRRISFVGGLSNPEGSMNGADILGAVPLETVWEAYASCRPGDWIYCFEMDPVTKEVLHMHVRLVTEAPVIVRRSDGSIDPAESKLIASDAGGVVYHYYVKYPEESLVRTTSRMDYRDKPGYEYLYTSSMNEDYPFSFLDLEALDYVPLSLSVYETEEVELSCINVLHDMTPETVKDGVRFSVFSNYTIAYLELSISDSAGQTVFQKRVNVGRKGYNQSASFADAETDAWLAAAPAGRYRLTAAVRSGPVLTVGGEVPLQTVLTLDFQK